MILGIDPGSRITGYGLLSVNSNALTAVDWGHIAPPASTSLAERIGIMAETVRALLKHFNPQALAIESQFVHLNPQSALKLGLVRGAILFAARLENVACFEYSPALIKKRCSGSGRACKQKMVHFIASTLAVQPEQLGFDAADALAAAYCHWRQVSIDPRIAATLPAPHHPVSSPL